MSSSGHEILASIPGPRTGTVTPPRVSLPTPAVRLLILVVVLASLVPRTSMLPGVL